MPVSLLVIVFKLFKKLCSYELGYSAKVFLGRYVFNVANMQIFAVFFYYLVIPDILIYIDFYYINLQFLKLPCIPVRDCLAHDSLAILDTHSNLQTSTITERERAE